MAVLTEEETVQVERDATTAAALDELGKAEAKVAELEEVLALARAAAAASTEAWAIEPGPEAKALQQAAWRDTERAAAALSDAQTARYRAITAAYGGRVAFEGSDEFALLETRPTHDEYKKLMQSTARMSEAKFEAKFEIIAEYVAILLREWKVLGRDGKELPRTPAGLAACPYDRMRPIFERAVAIFRGLPSPNL